MTKTEAKRRLAIKRKQLDRLYEAYDALASGGVKAYMIDDRQLTRFDLNVLSDEISKLEGEIDELEGLLNGGSRRKAVGIVPMPW